MLEKISAQNKDIELSVILRMVKNGSIIMPHSKNNIDDAFVSSVIEKLLMNIPIHVSGTHSFLGRQIILRNRDELLAIIAFLNNQVKVSNTVFKELNNKCFNDLEHFIINTLLEKKITISLFVKGLSDLNFLVSYFEFEFTKHELDCFFNIENNKDIETNFFSIKEPK